MKQSNHSLYDPEAPYFLQGGGQMGEYFRSYDWSSSPFGAPQTWPSSLKTCLRVLFTSAQASFICWGDDRFFFYNDAFAVLLHNRTPVESEGDKKNNFDFSAKEIESVFEKNEGSQQTVSFPQAQWGENSFLISYSPISDETGKVTGVFCTCQKVMPVKDGEEEGDLQFRPMANIIPKVLWIMSPTGYMEFANKRWEEIRGVAFKPAPIAEFLNSSIHPEDVSRVLEVVENALQTGQPFEVEERVLSASGEYQWFLNRGAPYRNSETGVIERWFGVSIDIHERKETEDALQGSNHQLALIIEATELATWDYNPRKNSFIGNDRLKEWFGLDVKDEIALPHALESIAEEDRDRVAEAINKALEYESGGTYDITYTLINPKTHQERIVRAKGKSYFDENKKVTNFYGAIRDITADIAAQRLLKQSEERFRMLADKLPLLIWMRDTEGQPEYTSAFWEEYSGIAEIREAWQWMAHPEDYDGIMEAWATHFQKGTPFRYSVRLRNKQGQYHWHKAIVEPIKDENGNILKWIGALSDIHTQKTFAESLEKQVAERTAELARSNRELEQSNEELHQFAHVASHDLKEPLRKIVSFAEMLTNEESPLLSESSKIALEKIRHSADRMKSMMDDILNFAQLETTKQKPVTIDLNETIRQVEADLDLLISQKGVKVTVEELPKIKGTPVLIYQLFYNLFNNSIKFARQDVPLHINVTSISMSSDMVTIHFADNSIGFEQKNARKIFKPFHRLHDREQYEGTGLGLSLCKRTVESHGGYIRAEGTEGVGATFVFTLPIA